MEESASTLSPLVRPLQNGAVQRLNLSVGFGYVRDTAGEHAYIFLAGKACSNAKFERLRVGTPVQFRLDERGRVHDLEALAER